MGHCFEGECESHCLSDRRKMAKMGRIERNGALSCSTGGKDRETEGAWGERKGREVTSFTEDLPFEVFTKK